MHRLALLIRACAGSFFFFFKKALYPTQCCPAKALDQNTHPRMLAHHEDPSKTAYRSWKEQQGKCLRQFFKRIMWFGGKANSTVDFRKIHSMRVSCEKT